MDDHTASLLATLVGLFFMAFVLAWMVVVAAGLWQVLTKAGRPGWGALIPFYNAVLILRIAGRPDIWVLLFLIPGVGLIFQLIVSIDLAKSFGRGTGFALGLFFLWPIFVPLLGFGSARYLGPAIAPATTPAPSY